MSFIFVGSMGMFFALRQANTLAKLLFNAIMLQVNKEEIARRHLLSA